MFLSAGSSKHAVGIVQAVGRICGCANPLEKRRLYTDKRTWKVYQDYSINRDKFNNSIENIITSEEEVRKVLATIPMRKISQIDRPNLKLKILNIEPPVYTEVDGHIDGVKISSIRKWAQAETVVAIIMRALYGITGSITEVELKELINHTGSDEDFASNIDNGRALKSKYGRVWTCNNGNISLNPKIRIFLDTIM